jgi:hypothetical protein
MLVSVAAALLVLAIPGARIEAQATTCKDGSTSTATGKGACSGHGGVDAKATAAAKKSAKAEAKTAAKSTNAVAKTEAKAAKTESSAAKTEAKAAKTEATAAKTEAQAAKTEAKAAERPAKATAATKTASSQASDKDPTGATAQCKDGTYSHAATRRGACSKHGGVDKWLKS